MNFFKQAIAGTLFLLLGLGGQAQAATTTTTTTFPVTATVLTTCVVAATPLLFGNYDPNNASPTDATNTVTVTCTVGTPYDVGLNEGAGAGASIATRKMTSGGNTLNYTLYQDSGHGTLWGNTIATDTKHVGTAGAVDTHTVYGRIPQAQNVAAGAYTDTITVTVTY